MKLITALAVSISILAIGATYLSLGTSLGIQVWALFIGWGSFYHTGGGNDGITKSAINHIWGVVVAAIALLVVGTVGGSVLVTSVIVGASVFVLVIAAHAAILSTIPAAVYGYASTAAFLLLTGVAIADVGANLKAASIIALSLIIGNAFGFVSEKVAGMLAASE
ncbi:MAG: DUF1097 domain-containing protein [Amylibacter sp.]